MINKQTSRALSGIAAQEEPQAPQPVEGIASAFLHAYLDCGTQEIQEKSKQLTENLRKTGLIQCVDTNEGYDQIPHRYSYEHTTHVPKSVNFHWINYL